MALAKGKIKKPVKSSTVSMSRMDFEIAILVYKRFTAIGLTDEEVSFLLGKRNKYVFDLLDPTEKDKFKTEQLDILPTILGNKIRDIVPNGIKPNENVNIKALKKVLPTKIVYEYVMVYPDNTESELVTITKKLMKGDRKKLHEQVHDLTLKLIEEGHFLKGRNALELFLLYKGRLEVPFSPADLQKSLAVLMNKKRNEEPILVCENEGARYWYRQYGFLEE